MLVVGASLSVTPFLRGTHSPGFPGSEILALKTKDSLFPPYVVCPKSTEDFMPLIVSSYDRSYLFPYVSKVLQQIVQLCRQP
jgi:hypothetical protein